jgi:hypothetical protein
MPHFVEPEFSSYFSYPINKKTPAEAGVFLFMAVREGFEPSIGDKPILP